MTSNRDLKLNEALVSVNRPSSVSTSLDVYHQNEECFGCQMVKLTTINDQVNSFIIDTRFNVRLKLQQDNDPERFCEFNQLSLNSHAHYRLNVITNVNRNESANKLNCSFETVEAGDCSLCPFAVLIFILFAFMAIEWTYATFVKKSTAQKIPSSSSSEAADSEETGQNNASNVADGQHLDHSGAKQDGKVTNVGVSNALPEVEESARSSIFQRRFNSVAARGTRIECLDAFRGLTIAGMIFVNYGGAGYAIWEHKPWNGLTLADFVFPFFIFCMGASIAISTRSLINAQERAQSGFHYLVWQILRRSLVLMILGLSLNSKWMNFDTLDAWADLRLTGVLQRFSISYFIVASMFALELKLDKWIRARSLTQAPYLSKTIGAIFELLTALSQISLYTYVTFFLDYNSNCPIGYTGPGGWTEGGKYANCTGGAAAWLDHLVLGERHLYKDKEVEQVFHTQISHDPEGILGCTGSILLTLIGLQCGKILNDRRAGVSHKRRIAGLLQWAGALAVSCSLVVVIPINKRLWSLTFVISTALAAFICVALLYLMLDVYNCKRSFLLQLVVSAGKNAVFLYVGHSLVYNLIPWWFPISDTSSHLQLLLRLSWAILVWLLIARYMDTKRLYIKV